MSWRKVIVNGTPDLNKNETNRNSSQFNQPKPEKHNIKTNLIPIYCFLLSAVIIALGGYVIYKYMQQQREKKNRYKKSAPIDQNTNYEYTQQHPQTNPHRTREHQAHSKGIHTTYPNPNNNNNNFLPALSTNSKSREKLDASINLLPPQIIVGLLNKFNLPCGDASSNQTVLRDWCSQYTDPIQYLNDQATMMMHQIQPTQYQQDYNTTSSSTTATTTESSPQHVALLQQQQPHQTV